MDKPEHLSLLDDVDAQLPAGGVVRCGAGRPIEAITRLAPRGEKRMSANRHANGGLPDAAAADA